MELFTQHLPELWLLSLLKQEDLYLHQMAQRLSHRSGGAFSLGESQLYPHIFRLMGQGFISDRKDQPEKRRARIYYHLEPAGEARLEELLKEYRQAASGTEGVLSSCGL